MPINDLVSELRGRAKESSADLAGYFNDYKLSLELTDNLSKLDTQLFEVLEFAERKGGIGHWLEQWNALMRDRNQRTDLSKMTDIADSIRAGIEFQNALLEQNYSEDPKRLETVVDDQVRAHLNTLAFEISRQVTEALQGRFEMDSPFSAARNTLKREDPREGQARAIALAVKNLSVAGIFMRIGERRPQDGQWVSLPDPASVSKSLFEWQEAATSMTALVQTIGTSDYPGKAQELSIARMLIEKQITAVNSLGEAAKAVLNEPSIPNAWGYSHFRKDDTLFQLSRIATTLLEQHRSWASQLKDSVAGQKLKEQVQLSENVCTMIQKKREDPSLPRFYEETLAASKIGSLRELWKATKNTLVNSVRLAGGKEAVKDLEKLFSSALGDHLDDWAKRQENPLDIRGLAWRLTDMLREYEVGAGKILEKYEESLNAEAGLTGKEKRVYLMEMMAQRLGAIRNAIAQGLDENIAAGLG
ncbi:MAG: hypothetical protein U0223_08345 [Nitrospira sp.]|nr:hypothetical protein [Nitrospira sp.]